MKKIFKRLARTVRRAREIAGSRIKGGFACGTCGFRGAPLHRKVLWPELVTQWALTPQWEKWFDEREGSRCAWCGSSLRSGQLARAIVQTVNRQAGTSARYLRELFNDPRARALSIAEINSAGNLHKHLARCPALRYSEYGSQTPNLPSEDLTRLSYADSSFDLAITSDTLEHVPNIDAALREIHRVIRPGTAHVFSTPVVWDRPTRQRAALRDGQVVHLLAPSYHGAPQDSKSDFLVFYEFGADFPDRCRAAGFELDLIRDDSNPALVTFIARKPF
jgi:SAM-dependent methyltransferase